MCSSLVFRSKRLAEMRGVFCFGAGDNVFPGGWEPQILYILDNQTLPKQQVPDLTFF